MLVGRNPLLGGAKGVREVLPVCLVYNESI